jgi:hypothetical protein
MPAHHVRLVLVYGLACMFTGKCLWAAIEMPNGEPIPTMVLPDPKTSDQGWMAWVCAEGYVPRESWRDGAKPSATGTKLTFMAPCFFLREPYQAAGKETNNWVLIGSKVPGAASDLRVDKVWGWVPESVLLTRIDCLKNPLSGIHHKVLMVNDPGKKKDDGRKLGMLVDAPFVEARPRKELKLYDPLFIFKMLPREDNARFMLVGTSPRFKVDDPSILGWVDAEKTDVVRWNTRQGIEWTNEATWPDVVPPQQRRTEPAEIIDSIEGNYVKFYPAEFNIRAAGQNPGAPRVLFPEAFAPISNLNLKEDIPPPLRQRFEATRKAFPDAPVSRGFRPMHMRPPLLESAKEVEEGNDPHDRLQLGRKPQKLRNELLYVGGIGGRNKLSAQEIDTIRAEASKLVGDLREIEILFLVDRTGSMDEFFPGVAKVIEEITNDAVARQRVGGGKVSVAVAMYDDRETDVKPRATPMIVLAPLDDVTKFAAGKTNKAGGAIAEKVRAAVAVGGGDPGEEMVQGLLDAVSQVRFSRWSYKMIVLLTDDGDHVAQKTKDLATRVALEQAELDKIQSALVPKIGSPVELFLVQVKDPDQTDASKSLQRQINYLLEAQLKWLPDSKRELVATKVIGQQGDVATSIRARYEQAKAEAEAKARQMAALASSSPVGIGPEVRRIYQAATGKNLDQYLAESDETQVFRPGFVWKYSVGPNQKRGDEQIRISLMLTRVELSKLNRFLEAFINEAETTDPKTALLRMIEVTDGDRFFEDLRAANKGVLTGNDIARAKLAIEFQTPLFKVDPNKLDQRLSRVDLEIVRHRSEILKGIEKNIAYSFEQQTITLAGEQIKVWRKKQEFVWDRFFSRYPGEDSQWCWIREDELP